jgi:hypothetical protein
MPLNERQVKLLNRLLDGFDGKLTSSKWAINCQMLARHGTARHHAVAGTRGAPKNVGRGAKYGL